MVSNLNELSTRLRGIPSRRWEAIARAAGCTASLPRKVVYEPERNFGVKTLEPLFSFFNDVDCGRRQIPAEDEQTA
jgi:hypothetical protein